MEVHAFRAGLLWIDDNPENESEYELDAWADRAGATRLWLKTILPVISRGGALRGAKLKVTSRSSRERVARVDTIFTLYADEARFGPRNSYMSVAEVANAGEDHGHAEFVGGCDDVLILD